MKLVIDLSKAEDVQEGHRYLGSLMAGMGTGSNAAPATTPDVVGTTQADPMADLLSGGATATPTDPMAGLIGGTEAAAPAVPTQQDVEDAFRAMAVACGRDAAIVNGNNLLAKLGIADITKLPEASREAAIGALNLWAQQAKAA